MCSGPHVGKESTGQTVCYTSHFSPQVLHKKRPQILSNHKTFRISDVPVPGWFRGRRWQKAKAPKRPLPDRRSWHVELFDPRTTAHKAEAEKAATFSHRPKRPISVEEEVGGIGKPVLLFHAHNPSVFSGYFKEYHAVVSEHLVELSKHLQGHAKMLEHVRKEDQVKGSSCPLKFLQTHLLDFDMML